MSVEEQLIPIFSILIPVVIVFVLRALESGKGQTTINANVKNLSNDLEVLHKAVKEELTEARQTKEKIADDHRKDMKEINNLFLNMSGDMKLHTNAISNLEKNLYRIEERIRLAEINIIRNTSHRPTNNES